MDKYLESIGKYLPAATGYFFLAVIALNAGVFRYIGYEWISALQLPDILSVSWPILPALALFVTSQITVLRLDTEKRSGSIVSLAEKHPKKFGAVAHLHGIFISAGPLIFITAFMLLPSSYSGAWLFISIITILLYLLGTLAYVIRKESFSKEKRAQFLFATASLSIVLLSFSAGATYGGFIYNRPYDDSILVDGETIENINVIFVMKEGVLARLSFHSVVYFPSDKIERISLNTACAEGVPMCNTPRLRIR